MAIRKDLDDMLNSLMDGGGSGGSTPTRSHNTPRAARKSKFDDMSVDDLLHALEEEKQHTDDEAVVPDDEPPAVWEFAPPSGDVPPVREEEEEVPNIISEVMHTEASAEVTRVFDSIPAAEELPKPVKKKKIVITGELPDYEALRREEMEREKQAQRAAEAAAEEAHAAERARRAAEAAAERARLEEEARQRRLAKEEAERQQLEQEEAERQRRIAQIEAEKQRRAEEAAEQARLAEEAERARLAEEAERARLAEEAEQARLAEEAEQARLAMEAEQQRRIEEMKRLAEEAVSETAGTNDNSISDEVDSAIEALGEAAEAAPVVETAPEEAEKPKKMGFFKKLINKAKEEPEIAAEKVPEDGLFEQDNSAVSATDLIDAAIAAINHPENEAPVPESDPVGNMLDNIREGAAEAIADMGNPEPKPFILTDEDIIAGLSPELKIRFDALDPDKQRQVIDMRRSQMGAIAPPAAEEAPEEAAIPEEEFIPEPAIEELSEALAETESVEEIIAEQQEEAPIAEAPAVAAEKPQEKTESDFENILSENPAELAAQRSEHTEKSPAGAFAVPDGRKRLYTVLGVVLTAFAVIGIISTIIWAIGCFRSFTSGEVKKDSFTQMIYPAAIMDIEPFSEPSQLTSEQIITATIWSIIMDKDKVSNYELTLDTITIPDVDVEKYAVELFGENLPEFNHTTVGPVESRFYYADGAYNVKVKTITHTYAPEIKSIVKSGKEYTLTVDYIAELPQWMEKNVAKQAEYKLTEKEDGTFRFNSMKILSVNNGNL
ncbi:MAG: hypothetical protein IKW96_07135 [Ruminococcus sp.]|uniref:cell envelope integrity protein TolA n=1 Tax=Ruminococcus sp. TaxID=41978 RepID=UPI0025CDA645|nr:hypothetical protein [Ruminococcus sp.]MBR5683037.1 hypothetical protein [Ruminococcus sp.]